MTPHSHMNRLASLLLLAAALVFSGCSSDEPSAPLSENPLDETPPLTPSGLTLGQQASTKFTITWSPNSEPDLAGYRVYLYRPDPQRAEAYLCLNSSAPLARTSTVFGGVSGSTYYFRISALDASGNESVWSEPFTFTFQSPADSDLPNEQVGEGENGPPSGHGGIGGPKELPENGTGWE